MNIIFPNLLLLTSLCSTLTAVRVIGRDAVVTEGHDVHLYCQLIETKEQLTRITWQKRTKEDPTNKNFFAINPDGKTEDLNGFGARVTFTGNTKELIGTILLKDVTLLDEGVFTCIFNIFPSGPITTEIKLEVQVPPVASVSTDVIPVVGESEVILATCTAAKAKPAPVVSWHLAALSDSIKVQTNESVDSDGLHTVRRSLIGVASKELNQQNVWCLVNHTSLAEELRLDYAIVIHYPPQLVTIISVNAASTFQEFQCVADANPPPTKFIWSRKTGTPSSLVDGDRLKIQRISDNNGLYICNASNPYGTGLSTIYVDVSSESSALSWSLFTILLVIFIGVLIWKFNLKGNLLKFVSQIREGLRNQPVATDSPSSTRNRSQSLQDNDDGF